MQALGEREDETARSLHLKKAGCGDLALVRIVFDELRLERQQHDQPIEDADVVAFDESTSANVHLCAKVGYLHLHSSAP